MATNILPDWLVEQIRAAQAKGLPTFRESENQSMDDLAAMQRNDAAAGIPRDPIPRLNPLEDPANWHAIASTTPPSFRPGEIKSLEDLAAMIAPAFEQRTVREAPLAGQPYAQPDAGAEAPLTGGQMQAAARTAPITTGSTTPAASRGGNAGMTQPGALDYVGAFLEGLSGDGGLARVRQLSERTEARNATADALLRKGVQPDVVQAAILNPQIMNQVLPLVFSGETQKVAPGEIIIDKSGRVVFDNSGTNKPTVVPAGGTLVGPNGQPVYQAPAKPRQFSVTDITKLSEEGSKFADLTGFVNTFKDNYAGYTTPGTGPAAMWAGRVGLAGKDTMEAAQWWQGYDRYKNIIRHDLFGSALTKTEQEQWNKADIDPSMDPATIKTNLARQKRLVENGLRRRANALIQAGYDPQVIAQAYGLDWGDIGVGAQSPRGGRGGGADQNPETLIEDARAAIEQGAPREAVIERLRRLGVEPEGL